MKPELILNQNSLNLKMIPLSFRELFHLKILPCDVYYYDRGSFEILLKHRAHIDKLVLKDLIIKNYINLFVIEQDHQKLIINHQNNLRNTTRSLSIGHTTNNIKIQLSLLSLNMHYLYNDVTDDDYLNLQYQSAKILANSLLDNMSSHKTIFQDFQYQKYHYKLSQPLLSSFFLLGLLKEAGLYNNKEIEQLFVTSYFKDIGMSLIPESSFHQHILSSNEKKLFLKHPEFSVNILRGRIPLEDSHVQIIYHHHQLSKMKAERDVRPISLGHGKKYILGFETLSVSLMDIVAAMISKRPYRPDITLFESLEHIKNSISESFPSEFKLIVKFFKQFYS